VKQEGAGPAMVDGPSCATPHTRPEVVQLGHGSGGRMSAALLEDHFLPLLDNPVLARLADAAVLPFDADELALTTDTFVVHPLEFPGGDIGSLAVHGTLNDLAVMGADPQYLTVGFVLEEGLPFEILDRVIASLAAAATEAGVSVVAGDTKVVDRGKADGMFINTTGVGAVAADFRPGPELARTGDSVLVSGAIGRHGMAIMAMREGLDFESEITSDCANLAPMVRHLRNAVGQAVHTMRDATRGGVASALNEIAATAGVGVLLEESEIPVPPDVRAACEVLGLDPLYVANEGVIVVFVAESDTDAALEALRSCPAGQDARRIGCVVSDHPGMVAMRTFLGGTRVVDLLPGDQLPRIC
jgi:hydrogenase expression/formation protein HypE